MTSTLSPGSSYRTRTIEPKPCQSCGRLDKLMYDVLSQMMVCRDCERRAGKVRQSKEYKEATRHLVVTDR